MKKILIAMLAAIIAVSGCCIAFAEFDVRTTPDMLYFYTDTNDDGTSDTYNEYTLDYTEYTSDYIVPGNFVIAYYIEDSTDSIIMVVLDRQIGTGTYYAYNHGTDVCPLTVIWSDGVSGNTMVSGCTAELYETNAYCDFMMTEVYGNHYAGGAMGYLTNEEETYSLFFWADFDFTESGASPAPQPTAEPTAEPYSYSLNVKFNGDYTTKTDNYGESIFFVGEGGMTMTFSGASRYYVSLIDPYGNEQQSFWLDGDTLSIGAGALYTEAPSKLLVTAEFYDGNTIDEEYFLQAASSDSGYAPEPTPALPVVTQSPNGGLELIPQRTNDGGNVGTVIPKR